MVGWLAKAGQLAIKIGPKLLKAGKVVGKGVGKGALAAGKFIGTGALKHPGVALGVAAVGDTVFNQGKLTGVAFEGVSGALGDTVSTVASEATNGVGNFITHALDGDGGNIIKAVGIGGGALAIAPLVINAIGAIGGLFKRKPKPQPGQAGEGGQNNAAMMMQQQMMMQQMAQQQQMMQQQMAMQQQPLQPQPQVQGSDQSSREISDLKTELAVLKATNKNVASQPASSVIKRGASGMTKSREFTKGPTRVEQTRPRPKPSQNPAEHSMTAKEKKPAPPKKGKPTTNVTSTNITIGAPSTNSNDDKTKKSKG